jgi:hypothetical protein
MAAVDKDCVRRTIGAVDTDCDSARKSVFVPGNNAWASPSCGVEGLVQGASAVGICLHCVCLTSERGEVDETVVAVVDGQVWSIDDRYRRLTAEVALWQEEVVDSSVLQCPNAEIVAELGVNQ